VGGSAQATTIISQLVIRCQPVARPVAMSCPLNTIPAVITKSSICVAASPVLAVTRRKNWPVPLRFTVQVPACVRVTMVRAPVVGSFTTKVPEKLPFPS
jgi:hypothetical protein